MPELEHKESIIALFNAGRLTLESAQWYIKHGYALVCNGGKVVDIIPDEI